MPNFQYKAGLMNVGSYQVSGRPFVSGNIDATTPARVPFPKVTRWVTIDNWGASDLYVAFSALGITDTDNYFLVASSGSVGPLELKVTELHLSGAAGWDATGNAQACVIAGLTFIEVAAVNNGAISPDGSNWSGSVGV